MKKTFTRALSLILVLVMVIGVMPMTFASVTDFGAGEISASVSSATVTAGHSVTLTATVPYDTAVYKDLTVEWNPEDMGAGTVAADATDPLKATFVAGQNAGTFAIVMVATCKTIADDAPVSVSKTVSVTVEAANTENPEDPEEVVISYKVELDPATLTLAVGEESEALKVIVTKVEGEEESVLPSAKYSIEGWKAAKSGGKEIASVDGDGVVTGVAAGTCQVEVSIKLEGETEERTAMCDVTVTDASEGEIVCENGDAKSTDSFTLKPVLKVNGAAVYDADFEFTPTSSYAKVVVSSDKNTASITNRQGGAAEVTISVKQYKLASSDDYVSGEGIEPIKAYVWFYDTNNITFTLLAGKTKVSLEENNVFSKIEINETEVNSLYNEFSFARIFEYLMDMGDYDGKPSKIYFENLSTYAAGQIVDDHGYGITYKDWAFLDKAYFSQSANRTGSSAISYKIVDKNDLIMMTGTFVVVITGGEGDIHYETTYSKPVTMKETDFQKFWTDQKLGTQYTMNYVTFDVVDMTGVLYTDSTKKTAVTSSMKFYVNPARGEYDLGSVYYVPNAKNTSEYVDGFNFRIYSIYAGTSVSGTVTIGLNFKSANITSRGVVMGTTHTNTIVDSYKNNTGKTLGYVVFELPEAKYGKLYSKLPVSGGNTKVAEGAELLLTDKVWYKPSKTTDLDLADVAFIPAAGFKGEVELAYTAYDAYGSYQYNGILRLNVTAKNASSVFSDVNTKSYSWAADSVDFLYYEGTAQGSNGKYNPASNITRRDFMLMLYRAFLAKDYSSFNVTTNFPDVVRGTDAYSREIYQAVGVAKYLGIAQGSNDKFNPKANITRQEAMVLIYRTLEVIRKDLEYTTTTNITSFKDYSKISSWATASITYLVNHGVIQGTNDMINPAANITRAEMACILHRVLTY